MARITGRPRGRRIRGDPGRCAVSAEFRQFLARLAIDPNAYGRFLDDPESVAREAGLSDPQIRILMNGDQNRLYAALTTDTDPARGDE